MQYSTVELRRHFRADAMRFGGVPLWLIFRALPTLLALALLLLVLSIAPARASVSEGGRELAPNGVQSGQLLFQSEQGGSYTAALIQSSEVHFDISGMIATVSVEQTFRNNTQGYVEGVYAFPLPDDAAVRFMEMEVGGRRIVGKIREKAQAKKIYQAAKKAGKRTSLVEQQRPNLFSNRVANIGPGEEITVRLEYVQSVAFDTSTFSLRFPMTITPRYMPGSALSKTAAARADELELAEPIQLNPYRGWSKDTDEVVDAAAISPLLNPSSGNDNSPINPIAITATLDMGMPLASVISPYHDIALQRRAGVYRIDLANGSSEMDRDFVLNWRPVTGSVPKAALFYEKVEAEHYGLLMLVPPAAERTTVAIPREMIFIVDTSGSMGGVSIEQARASVARALQQLQPTDRFNIIEFNTGYRKLYARAMPANAHYIQKAQEFVRLLDASGGTEMLPALQAALATDKSEEEAASFLRQVIFITDGAVGNEAALYAEIAQSLGASRLFTIGIGSAPNSWFMRKAAQFGRGTHTHIGNLNEVGEKMGLLFEQLARPAATNLQVDWPAGVEAWPERIPDLYMGRPVMVAVKFSEGAPSGEVRVSALIAGREWHQALVIGGGADPERMAGHEGVASLWARNKIAGLLDQKMQGRSEQDVRAQVLPIALQHQLLSPYTSFVAVEEVVTRPADAALHGKSVLNTRPRGQAPQKFAYPATATTGPAKAWFGLLCLFMALLLRLVRQVEVDHAPVDPKR